MELKYMEAFNTLRFFSITASIAFQSEIVTIFVKEETV